VRGKLWNNSRMVRKVSNRWVQTFSAGYPIDYPNTNILRLHPSTGEFFSPPLGGDPDKFENRELLAKST
jgi:hypothetical protein